MVVTDKDTIYIDIDDEITGVIDKLHSSSGKVVALVLPKRAAVFQSIVNMKLLKRAADDAKKHLVLITSETGLLPLAGAAGVHVAKTLTSKPEIPVGPGEVIDTEETIGEDDDIENITAETAGAMPIGDLAGLTAPPIDDGVETVELDNEEPAETAGAATGAVTAAKAPKPKKDNKLQVPNFERFRLLLIAGLVALVLLIILFVIALNVLPKATIAIKTDATSVPVSLGLNLSTTASSPSTSDSTLPAKIAQQQKTYSQQVGTTGQKNLGNKASGEITITNCSPDNSDLEIPAGTSVSSGGQNYIMQSGASLPFSGHRNNGKCQSANGISSGTVGITAQSPGSQSNTGSGASFSVSGYGNTNASANGSISGGTDNNVQVVTQTDISNAKNKINTSDDSVKQALQSQLKGQGYTSIDATYSSGTPATTSSTNVGDAANNVTVTETVTYALFGVKQADLRSLLDDAIKSKIDTSKQSILDDGLGSANYNVSNSSTTGAQVTLATSATAGPQLDIVSIKQQAAGKKSADIISQLKANPDVTDVTVKLSPFWVSSVPKKASKITVTVAKPVAKAGQTNANNP